MADHPPATRPDEGQWSGVEDTIEDPEETKVIFSALDSFALVYRLPLTLAHTHRPDLFLYKYIRNM